MRPLGKSGIAAVVLLAAGAVAAHFEGYVPHGYSDVVGVVSACRGHTGTDVKLGEKYTPEQCEAWFRQDLAIANATVHRCVTRSMPPNVEAALTSFTYNVGPGRVGVKDGFCWLKNGRQPRIRILANAGDWAGVCNQFQYWTSAGSKWRRGLERRRAAERALCEKQD